MTFQILFELRAIPVIMNSFLVILKNNPSERILNIQSKYYHLQHEAGGLGICLGSLLGALLWRFSGHVQLDPGFDPELIILYISPGLGKPQEELED